MYQTIDEAISVIGIYQNKFKPVKFKWRNKIYQVEQITLTAEVKDGGIRGRTYSVLSKGTLYRLYFNRDDERWILRELWVE